MEKLTKEDIQKIALYTPFKVRIAPILSPNGFYGTFLAKGQIGSVIIESYDKNEHSIVDCSDINHPKNEDRPVLYRLEDMSEAQCQHFIKLIPYDPGLNSRKHLAALILNECNPSVFFYALSEHFDMFGLINDGKATDAKTLQ